MTYTDTEVLESFTLWCLFPACYTPLSLSGSSSHYLARISRCVQDMSAILVNFVHSPSFVSHAAKQRTYCPEFVYSLTMSH